ncbi:hypothetical protein [uncultured Friedmanniella sp.]|uniref:hypothetical protein n=1 Tax=uncultured Friedmanniella sp. TaxID=335381 RepID=UPI0035CA4C75
MAVDLGKAAGDVLGQTLADQGFVVDGSSSSAVTFRDEQRLLELSYYPEDPTPWLSVVLGLRETSAELRVALWRLFPEAPRLAAAENGQFSSSETLVDRLVTVRDAWLDQYIWPAFEQPERFRRAWLAQQDEAEQRYQAGVQDQRLRQARSAFDRGDLPEAVEQYPLAGIDSLSAADRGRYIRARPRP